MEINDKQEKMELEVLNLFSCKTDSSSDGDPCPTGSVVRERKRGGRGEKVLMSNCILKNKIYEGTMHGTDTFLKRFLFHTLSCLARKQTYEHKGDFRNAMYFVLVAK